MPFTKYANSSHRCDPPRMREDRSPLQIGDEWRCDERLSSLYPGMRDAPTCNKTWRYTSGDQREPDNYWTPFR